MGRPPAGPAVPGRKRGRPPKNRNNTNDANNTTTTTTTSTNSSATTTSPASIRTVCYYRRGSIPLVSSTTATTTSSQSALAYSNNSSIAGNENGGQYQFPRRYPRISGYYQMKDIPLDELITESSTEKYSSQRQAPIPMSTVVPFRTECEIQNQQIHYYDSVAGEDIPGPIQQQQHNQTNDVPSIFQIPIPVESSTDSTRKNSAYFPTDPRNTSNTITTAIPEITTTNETSTNCMRLIHKPSNILNNNKLNGLKETYNNSEDWFPAYTQLGSNERKRSILANSDSSESDDEDEDKEEDEIHDEEILQRAYDHEKWKQQIRSWYADTVVANDFPLTHTGNRSTKSRYKKSTTTTTTNGSRSTSEEENDNSSTATTGGNGRFQPRLPLLDPPQYLQHTTPNPKSPSSSLTKEEHEDDIHRQQHRSKKRRLSNTRSVSPTVGFPQGSEYALAYRLHYSQPTNCTTPNSASFACLLEWNRRRACKAIRYRGKIVQNGKLVSCDTEEDTHWRSVALRTISLYGDFRSVRDSITTEDNSNASEDITEQQDSPQPLQALSQHQQQEVRKTWKAVTTCAFAIRDRLRRKGGLVPKLFFSSVVHFLGHVARLQPLPGPMPSRRSSIASSSSTNRSIVDSDSDDEGCVVPAAENVDQILQHISDSCTRTRTLFAQLLDTWGSQDGVDIDNLRKQLESAEKESDLALDYSGEMKRQLDIATEWQGRLDSLLKEQDAIDSADLYTDSDCQPDDLRALEALQEEGSLLGFRTKSMIGLEAKILKGRQLRDRIVSWKQSSTSDDEKKETMKFIMSIVRDINRVKLRFTEVSQLLRFHQKAEAWVDRANIAIRSRISLEEIKSLIETGTNDLTPLVDISEYMEKLVSRVETAEDWIRCFKKVLLSKSSSSCVDSDDDNMEEDVNTEDEEEEEEEDVEFNLTALESMMTIRTKLDDKEHNCALHELASEGSRIPVEVEYMKMLQLELDSRGWSSKTKKWIPTVASSSESQDLEGATSSKRVGKLEEVRDHLAKASTFRDRLNGISSMAAEERRQWILEGELELKSVVDSADNWLDKYQAILDIDGRKNDARNNMSLTALRNIVAEGNAIHVNLGNPLTKILRILTQAENWYKTYEAILLRCNIKTGQKVSTNGEFDRESESPAQKRNTNKKNKIIKMKDLKDAIEAAYSDVSVDLDEASDLEAICEKIEDWQKRALITIGEETKRSNARRMKGRFARKSSTPEYSVDDLTQLIDEAKEFPLDQNETLSTLQQHLDTVLSWQRSVAKDIENIGNAFRQLREALLEAYGQPDDFEREKYTPSNNESDTKSRSSSTTNRDGADFDLDKDDDVSIFGSNNGQDSEDPIFSSLSIVLGSRNSEQYHDSSMSNSGDPLQNIQELIKAFNERSAVTCVVTPERLIASELNDVMRWCMRSLRTLSKQKSVFDKRFFVAFDRFVQEGEDLLKSADAAGSSSAATSTSDVLNSDEEDLSNTEELVQKLRMEWAGVVGDQLRRLGKLASDRKRFTALCSKIESFLSDDNKKLTFEKLDDLVTKSNEFPSTTGVIRQIRVLHTKVSKWISTAKKALEAISPSEKITFDDAKTLVDAGEKLMVQCTELRVLRNGLKAAKGWLSRLKKLNVGESNCANVKAVKILVEEHDALVVALPDEVTKLRQLSKDYCLCRRPFDGFMIGCDGCDEWFHGPCIGVTESKADKVSKYVCVRCSVAKVFKSSSATILDVIRKWTATKDLKKARRIEMQKHQRKVRKETKDHERCRDTIKLLQQRLIELENGNVTHQQTVLSAPINSGSLTDGMVIPLDGVDTSNDENKVVAIPPDLSKEEVLSRIAQETISMDRCATKLENLTKLGLERKQTEASENTKGQLLAIWCIRVRSLVLVPSNKEILKKSRPKRNGMLSDGMVTVIDDAKRFGLESVEDVKIVINALKCQCWSLWARSVLRKQASVVDLKSLLNQAAVIELPDEKAVKMLKSLLQRSNSWESKVCKAITPCPGETKPFNMDVLKELSIAGDDIPIIMPYEQRLLTVIEDFGTRHCLCGGPSDGRFMVACEQCDHWFHGHCVNVSRHTSEDDLTGWKCPRCTGEKPAVNTEHLVENFHNLFDHEHETVEMVNVDDDDCKSSSESSTSGSDLWPPYGLLGSAEATEALGEECAAIPEFAGEWTVTAENGAVVQSTVSVDVESSTSQAFFSLNEAMPRASIDVSRVTGSGKCLTTSNQLGFAQTLSKVSSIAPTMSGSLFQSTPSLFEAHHMIENIPMDISDGSSCCEAIAHLETPSNEIPFSYVHSPPY